MTSPSVAARSPLRRASACACLATLVSASCTMRKTAVECAAGSCMPGLLIASSHGMPVRCVKFSTSHSTRRHAGRGRRASADAGRRRSAASPRPCPSAALPSGPACGANAVLAGRQFLPCTTRRPSAASSAPGPARRAARARCGSSPARARRRRRRRAPAAPPATAAAPLPPASRARDVAQDHRVELRRRRSVTCEIEASIGNSSPLRRSPVTMRSAPMRRDAVPASPKRSHVLGVRRRASARG